MNWDRGGINNTGIILHWSPLNGLSFEAKGFYSMQYGYALFSKLPIFGTSLKLKYELNSKVNFYIWGQYIYDSNNDPIIQYMNNQPRTELGMGMEYKPSENTNIGIRIGTQEDVINKKKYSIVIEGKASIKF